ncbi:hypothetical protein DRO24_04135 [Candidatus Bathyarchaeota archaeon]|nr:MAG: hypothetical protein DRO24_04135 [Candidatus Bathyarchaeota archaeon]
MLIYLPREPKNGGKMARAKVIAERFMEVMRETPAVTAVLDVADCAFEAESVFRGCVEEKGRKSVCLESS